MQSLSEFARQNPFVLSLITALIYPIVTALINALFAPRTDAELEQFCARSPKFGAFIRFTSHTGVEPSKVIGLIGDVVRSLINRLPPAGGAAALAFVLAIGGCAFLKDAGRGALSVADMLCVVANAELPDDKGVMAACGIDQALAPLVRDLISQKKSGKLAGYHVSKDDAGPPDAGVADAKSER